MATTCKLITSTTVGAGGVSSVTFSSIPQTYNDLLVKGSVRTTATGQSEDLSLRVNGSSSSYNTIRIGSTGSAVFTDAYPYNTPGRANASSASASIFNNFEVYIPNYTANRNKLMNFDTVTEDSANYAISQLVSGLWSDTATISSLEFYVNSASLVQYSTLYLYGINNS